MASVALGFASMYTTTTTITCGATNKKLEMMGKSVNFYRLLSLDSENAGAPEIKKAYRSMALRYHPDVCPPSGSRDESTRMFVELHRAYETLSDPASRRKYDFELGLSGSERASGSAARRAFSREAWENQLCELQWRSVRRMGRKAGPQRAR